MAGVPRRGSTLAFKRRGAAKKRGEVTMESLTVRRPTGGSDVLTDWGLNSDYGTLRDVLLGPIDNYRWMETSAISKRSFRLGRQYNPQTAQAQYREVLDVYAQAGVTVHTLPADPHLPYQLFARDSSVMTPWGAIVTQMHHPWRRGEYAPVLQFYQSRGIPLYDMVTASAFEGGDFNLLEPGVVLCGYTNDRSQEPGMRQIKSWIEAEGWEFRPYQLDPFDLLAERSRHRADRRLLFQRHRVGLQRGRAGRRPGAAARRQPRTQTKVPRPGPDRVRSGSRHDHRRRRRAALHVSIAAPRPGVNRVAARPVRQENPWRGPRRPVPRLPPGRAARRQQGSCSQGK